MKAIVSQAEFVKAYMEVYKENGSLDDVAEKIGASHSSTTLRANRFIRRGIKLPKLPSHSGQDKSTDKELNSIVDSFLKED